MADNFVGALPALDEFNTFFWKSGEDGKLRMQQCGECSKWVHPPSVNCRYCMSESLEPQALSGRGTLVALTVNHMPWMPGLAVPYLIVIVELAEQKGLRLTSAMPSHESGTVKIGDEVVVSFQQRDDVWVPFFTLAN